MEEEWTYEVADEGREEETTVAVDAQGSTTSSSSPPPVQWSRVTTERYVENHASFHPFTTTTNTNTQTTTKTTKTRTEEWETLPPLPKHNVTSMVQQWVNQGAQLVTLHPGEGLFLPEFWSHAVVSTVGSPDENGTDATMDGSSSNHHRGSNSRTTRVDAASSSHDHRYGNEEDKQQQQQQHDINLAINVWFKRP